MENNEEIGEGGSNINTMNTAGLEDHSIIGSRGSDPTGSRILVTEVDRLRAAEATGRRDARTGTPRRTRSRSQTPREPMAMGPIDPPAPIATPASPGSAAPDPAYPRSQGAGAAAPRPSRVSPERASSHVKMEPDAQVEMDVPLPDIIT